MATVMASVRPVLRVTERELRFYRTAWRGTAFTTVIAPLLYLVALGVGLGDLVTEPESFGELTYLQYIAPGLLVGAGAQMAAGSGLWPIMAGHRWLGFHRAMVASPIRPAEVVAGWMVWVGARAAIQGTAFLVAAALLGAITSAWAPVTVAVSVVTAMAVVAPIMAFTATQDTDGTFDPLMRVVVAPLYLFSGGFFPTDSLPIGLQWVVRCFPLWHGIEVGRWAAVSHPSTWPIALHLMVIAVWLVGGGLVARRTFTRRLAP